MIKKITTTVKKLSKEEVKRNLEKLKELKPGEKYEKGLKHGRR